MRLGDKESLSEVEVITMKIGFVGAGKVGFSLGKYFCENNLEVIGYYSRSVKSSEEAAEFTGTKCFYQIKEIVESSDIIFITTPDSEILSVWNQLKKLSIRNKLICHCSGVLSSEIFSDISKCGAYSYSVHPMFAISDKYNSYKNLNQAFITIEGDKEKINEVISIIEKTGNKYRVISKDNKKLYHLASVISSNLVTGLVNNGILYLESCGFTQRDAIDALYPLIKNNIENIKERGPVDSLTGPLERGDVKTIEAHIEVIPKKDRLLYIQCSRNLIPIAEEKNPERNYIAAENLLEGMNEYEEHSSNF